MHFSCKAWSTEGESNSTLHIANHEFSSVSLTSLMPSIPPFLLLFILQFLLPPVFCPMKLRCGHQICWESLYKDGYIVLPTSLICLVSSKLKVIFCTIDLAKGAWQAPTRQIHGAYNSCNFSLLGKSKCIKRAHLPLESKPAQICLQLAIRRTQVRAN